MHDEGNGKGEEDFIRCEALTKTTRLKRYFMPPRPVAISALVIYSVPYDVEKKLQYQKDISCPPGTVPIAPPITYLISCDVPTNITGPKIYLMHLISVAIDAPMTDSILCYEPKTLLQTKMRFFAIRITYYFCPKDILNIT